MSTLVIFLGIAALGALEVVVLTRSLRHATRKVKSTYRIKGLVSRVPGRVALTF